MLVHLDDWRWKVKIKKRKEKGKSGDKVSEWMGGKFVVKCNVPNQFN